MFFIFGIGPKTKVIEKSQFLCPVCRTRSAYELKQQRNYFSLFFIPLIPLSKAKSAFVRCLNCGTVMPSTVLDHAQPDPQRQSSLEA
ncbi:zinc ribbon domain-containing protein [Acinetobacter bohemicus]|uniref:Zinc ribbon domain-containing protein n=1 Tax=Acinetobacter lwoffii TaxID=28090 RepID=A0A9D2URL8_ACILW|nr:MULTISPECIES: zinc ribbon domain-containing protein [unclassified Acinetobacter]MCO8043816.1 zinc ribbon domain-containing protein [Acinetobacter sp. S4397-1]TQR67695.1 zinc ribbon domain-containing protein [Acinetobacter sp. RF14B]HJF27444.1 zinc ribbon domain-containing protein [Acinetobacter lwoffii]